jgi:secondary thiamine-phosphate synthase enzyme
MPEFRVGTGRTQEMVDITEQVEQALREAKVADGLCLVFTPHATAAVVVNENADPNVCQDILDAMSRMVPEGSWRHDRVDNNAAAHIKAAMLGPGETLAVRGGRLRLGTWQSVMLVEFDGPRERTVLVEVAWGAPGSFRNEDAEGRGGKGKRAIRKERAIDDLE